MGRRGVRRERCFWRGDACDRGLPGFAAGTWAPKSPGEPQQRRVRLSSPCREAEGKARCQSPHRGWWAPRRDFCQLSEVARLLPTVPAAREGGALPPTTARERAQSTASVPAHSKLNMQSHNQRPSPTWPLLATGPFSKAGAARPMAAAPTCQWALTGNFISPKHHGPVKKPASLLSLAGIPMDPWPWALPLPANLDIGP